MKKYLVRSMHGGSRNSKERLCGVVGARGRMVGDEFIIYLMNDSECMIGVKSHGTKLNSI